MDELDRIEEHRDLTAGLEYESRSDPGEFTFPVPQGLTLKQIADEVDGYPVIRYQGNCFVQPRTQEEADRLRALGATMGFETMVYGRFVCEARLHTMLPPSIEYDEEGSLIDNRRDIVLSFFRERDGYAGFPGVSV